MRQTRRSLPWRTRRRGSSGSSKASRLDVRVCMYRHMLYYIYAYSLVASSLLNQQVLIWPYSLKLGHTNVNFWLTSVFSHRASHCPLALQPPSPTCKRCWSKRRWKTTPWGAQRARRARMTPRPSLLWREARSQSASSSATEAGRATARVRPPTPHWPWTSPPSCSNVSKLLLYVEPQRPGHHGRDQACIHFPSRPSLAFLLLISAEPLARYKFNRLTLVLRGVSALARGLAARLYPYAHERKASKADSVDRKSTARSINSA